MRIDLIYIPVISPSTHPGAYHVRGTDINLVLDLNPNKKTHSLDTVLNLLTKHIYTDNRLPQTW